MQRNIPELDFTTDKKYLSGEQYSGMTNYQHRRDFSQHGHNVSTAVWTPLQYTGCYSLSGFDKILEVGCGDGTFWKNMIGNNVFHPHVLLTDLSENMLEACKFNLSNIKINADYQVADLDVLPFGVGQFNAVLAHLVIYHSENPEQSIKAIHNVLKQNGILGLSVLNEGVNKSIWKLANSIDPRVPIQSFTARFTNIEADKILPAVFQDVEKRDYVNTLQFKTSEPIVNMVKSSPLVQPLKLSDQFFTLFKEKIDKEILVKDHFETEFNASLYLCRKG